MRGTGKRGAAVLTVLLALTALGGCGLLGGEPRETPEVRVEREAGEARIRQEVEARLAAEPSIGPGRIRVVVTGGGDVQLHGPVVGFGALQCALANAELTPGVRLVIDHMELLPGPREARCLAPRVFGGPGRALSLARSSPVPPPFREEGGTAGSVLDEECWRGLGRPPSPPGPPPGPLSPQAGERGSTTTTDHTDRRRGEACLARTVPGEIVLALPRSTRT